MIWSYWYDYMMWSWQLNVICILILTYHLIDMIISQHRLLHICARTQIWHDHFTAQTTTYMKSLSHHEWGVCHKLSVNYDWSYPYPDLPQQRLNKSSRFWAISQEWVMYPEWAMGPVLVMGQESWMICEPWMDHEPQSEIILFLPRFAPTTVEQILVMAYSFIIAKWKYELNFEFSIAFTLLLMISPKKLCVKGSCVVWFEFCIGWI